MLIVLLYAAAAIGCLFFILYGIRIVLAVLLWVPRAYARRYGREATYGALISLAVVAVWLLTRYGG